MIKQFSFKKTTQMSGSLYQYPKLNPNYWREILIKMQSLFWCSFQSIQSIFLFTKKMNMQRFYLLFSIKQFKHLLNNISLNIPIHLYLRYKFLICIFIKTIQTFQNNKSFCSIIWINNINNFQIFCKGQSFIIHHIHNFILRWHFWKFILVILFDKAPVASVAVEVGNQCIHDKHVPE